MRKNGMIVFSKKTRVFILAKINNKMYNPSDIILLQQYSEPMPTGYAHYCAPTGTGYWQNKKIAFAIKVS